MLFLVSVSTEIGTVNRKLDKRIVCLYSVYFGKKTGEMAASRNHVLKLYKTMLRESQKFSSYNYRLFENMITFCVIMNIVMLFD